MKPAPTPELAPVPPSSATSPGQVSGPSPEGTSGSSPPAATSSPSSQDAGAERADPERPPESRKTPWRSLRHRSMRWWTAANLISNAGTWMQMTVQNLLVLQISGSAAVTGLSLSVQAAPGLLLGMAGGSVVDAWPRKLTAGVSQAALGVVAVVMAALVAGGMVSVPVLLGLAFVTGLVATIDGPACSLLGNDLVPSRDVPSAIAVGSVAHSSGRLLGTAAAGGAVGLFGTAAAYAANGLSFLCVAAVIPFLRLYREPVAPVASDVPQAGASEPPPKPRPAVPRQRARPGAADRGGRAGSGDHRQWGGDARESLRDRVRGCVRIRALRRAGGGQSGRTSGAAPGAAREGLTFFIRRPRLVALACVTGISAIFGRNYSLTLAVLVSGPLAGGAEEFGMVSTVLAVGGILGALVAGRLTNPSVRLVGLLAATGALLQVAAGLAPSLMVLVLLVAPMALIEAVSDTTGRTVLQTEPPPHMRGRVLGVWRSASTGWGLAGPALVGVLMEVLGPRGALVAGGLIIAGAVATGWLCRPRLVGGLTRRPATA